MAGAVGVQVWTKGDEIPTVVNLFCPVLLMGSCTGITKKWLYLKEKTLSGPRYSSNLTVRNLDSMGRTASFAGTIPARLAVLCDLEYGCFDHQRFRGIVYPCSPLGHIVGLFYYTEFFLLQEKLKVGIRWPLLNCRRGWSCPQSNEINSCIVNGQSEEALGRRISRWATESTLAGESGRSPSGISDRRNPFVLCVCANTLIIFVFPFSVLRGCQRIVAWGDKCICSAQPFTAKTGLMPGSVGHVAIEI